MVLHISYHICGAVCNLYSSLQQLSEHNMLWSAFWFKNADILRETQLSQFYRYAKISQLLEAGQFCRYVGGIATFLVRRYFCFPEDICNC